MHPASPDYHATWFTRSRHKGLVGGGGSAPPPIKPPAPMPTPDDDAIKAAKQRQLAMIMARSGRQSTMLTDQNQSDKLGA